MGSTGIFAVIVLTKASALFIKHASGFNTFRGDSGTALDILNYLEMDTGAGQSYLRFKSKDSNTYNVLIRKLA